MKNTLKKYSRFTVGLLIFGFGISFGNKSLFGGNSMSILVSGIARHATVSYGTCNLMVGAVEFMIGYLAEKKNCSFATIFSLFCGSYAIDLANWILPDCTSLAMRILYMLAGILTYCLGLAIQQKAGCGYGNLDCCIFGLAKVFHVEKYHNIRWIIDALFIAGGYLLGAIVSVGTLILLAFAGLIIERLGSLVETLFRRCDQVGQSIKN